MTKNTLFIYSVVFGVVLFVGCAPQHQLAGNRTTEALISVGETSKSYNLEFEFMKNNFDGMLIVKRMENDEIRFFFNTYFGWSVFDLGLKNDGLVVYNCIEPLRNEKILEILANDFKLLFLTGNDFKRLKKTAEYITFASGKGLKKVKIVVFDKNAPDIIIKHPLLRLKLGIKPI